MLYEVITPTGYYIEKKKKIGRGDNATEIPYEEQLSNFTMEIKKTLIEGDTHIREVIFKGQDGSESKPHICKVGTNILREFKTWVWSCGDYHYTGSQEELVITSYSIHYTKLYDS